MGANTTYTYYAGDATNQTTTEIPDKDYVDDTVEEYSSAYWIGTRAEYNELETPLADGTLVFITDDTLPYLPKSGGALTGDVTTSVTEFTNTSLVTKGYVDAIVGDINAVLEEVL